MSKTVKIIIAVVAIIFTVLVVIPFVLGFIDGFTSEIKNNSNLTINKEEDLSALVDEIYAGVKIEMPALMTLPVDITDNDVLQMYTGLSSAENIEYAVVSEPMMSSQAYSMVLVKTKDGADVDAMAKSMNENIDERKWICVTAEKIYTTTSGNVICLVMSNPDTAKTVYDSFKNIAGGIGQEYERAAEEIEMPDDMLPGQDGMAL